MAPTLTKVKIGPWPIHVGNMIFSSLDFKGVYSWWFLRLGHGGSCWSIWSTILPQNMVQSHSQWIYVAINPILFLPSNGLDFKPSLSYYEYLIQFLSRNNCQTPKQLRRITKVYKWTLGSLEMNSWWRYLTDSKILLLRKACHLLSSSASTWEKHHIELSTFGFSQTTKICSGGSSNRMSVSAFYKSSSWILVIFSKKI